MSRFTVILFAVTLLLPSLALAKRAAPAKAEPVVYSGTRYVAPNDDGRRAYIEAWDVQTDKKLWDLTIFTNRIDPKLEEDVQWVFIKALEVRDNALRVATENDKTYWVDLKTKKVTGSEQLTDALKPASQHVSDHKPSYKDFVSAHTFPYIAPPDRQNHLRQNYSFLSVGFSKAKVIEILGEPDYSQQSWSKEASREYLGSSWMYFFEKPDSNLTNLRTDKNIEVFFDPNDRVHWIVSNVEGLPEIGSPRRQESPSPAANSQ